MTHDEIYTERAEKLFGEICGDIAAGATGEPIKAIELAFRSAVLAERERCAAIVDKLGADWWGLYKQRNGPHRADPFYEGKSDGADEIAASIRKEPV